VLSDPAFAVKEFLVQRELKAKTEGKCLKDSTLMRDLNELLALYHRFVRFLGSSSNADMIRVKMHTIRIKTKHGILEQTKINIMHYNQNVIYNEEYYTRLDLELLKECDICEDNSEIFS
jgi:hypothetical protein